MILSTATLGGVTPAPSIIEDIDFLVNTDSFQYPLADKLRNINAAYYDVVTAILASQSNWEWDDTNKTDFPIGTATLVAGQRDYSLPTDFLKLLRVEVLDSAGNYQKVIEFDETQIQGVGLNTFMNTTGLPLYYREIANSIELYPVADAASVTLAAGLKVYYQRNQSEFGIGDAAVSPGFAPQFHRILSLRAAYDFSLAKGLIAVNPRTGRIMSPLKNELDTMMTNLMEYYSSRNREVRPKLQIKQRKYI